MSENHSDFRARLEQRVAESDAQVDADLADIMAGRPFKRREVPLKTKAVRKPAAPKDPNAPKKPRAKRKPKTTSTDD